MQTLNQIITGDHRPNHQQERRRYQSLIVEQVARITQWPSARCWGVAGKWLRQYGHPLTVEVLARMSEGTPIPVCVWNLERAKAEAAMARIEDKSWA